MVRTWSPVTVIISHLFQLVIGCLFLAYSMPILIRAWLTCYGVENDGDMVGNSILLLTFPYQGKLILPLPGIFPGKSKNGQPMPVIFPAYPRWG